jgi:hypothetical protein
VSGRLSFWGRNKANVSGRRGILHGTLQGVTVIFEASWPGLSRLSMSFLFEESQDVDARHKAGHDESTNPASLAAFSASL